MSEVGDAYAWAAEELRQLLERWPEQVPANHLRVLAAALRSKAAQAGDGVDVGSLTFRAGYRAGAQVCADHVTAALLRRENEAFFNGDLKSADEELKGVEWHMRRQAAPERPMPPILGGRM